MSSTIRSNALRHLVTIRERLSKTYRDDTLWGALAALDEALQIEPIEAEREAIVELLLDTADEYENKGHGIVAHAMCLVADKVRARDGRPVDPVAPTPWTEKERHAWAEANTVVPACATVNCTVCSAGVPPPGDGVEKLALLLGGTVVRKEQP